MRPNLDAFGTLVANLREDRELRTPSPILPPRVNLNGDTKQTLLQALLDIKGALDDADELMARLTPHGRNYQTYNEPEYACRIAREAWRERRLVLQALSDEVYGLAEHVSNQ